MTVRGWLIIGSSPDVRAGLSWERHRGDFGAALPDASLFNPGDWITWFNGTNAILVCVEVPV